MKILKTSDEHFAEATKLLKNADRVIGSTYGLFVRLWSDTPSGARQFLEAFEGGEFIIGSYNNQPCREDCPDCLEKFRKSQKFLDQCTDKYSGHKWHKVYGLHLKALCFKYPDGYKAIVGGRNLSDSGWRDLSFVVEGDEAKKIFNLVKKTIKEVSNAKN